MSPLDTRAALPSCTDDLVRAMHAYAEAQRIAAGHTTDVNRWAFWSREEQLCADELERRQLT